MATCTPTNQRAHASHEFFFSSGENLLSLATSQGMCGQRLQLASHERPWVTGLSCVWSDRLAACSLADSQILEVDARNPGEARLQKVS